MKHVLPMENITVMPSHRERGDPGARVAAQDSARVQGDDWSTQGFNPHIHQERR